MKTSATEIIERVRGERMKLADVLKDEEYDGIREHFEELYPDKAHFIYELLQNAEDAHATNAKFSLSEGALEFEHDGQPFSEEDLRRITNVAKKGKGPDTIGRFGVGFKAVYAYTETPRIWSPTFSFEITDWVLPKEIEGAPDLGKLTRFEFPFNSTKKPAATALSETRAGLDDLSELSLLFLSHIESISWNVLDGPKTEALRIRHSDHHFEVLKQSGNETVASSHFLVFFKRVDSLTTKELAVAFPLEDLSRSSADNTEGRFADSFRVVPALPGTVSVYFPAAKEPSGLRFHLHAPFVTDVSRASIKETPANDELFEQLSRLIASSALPKIRDLGLLTIDFLGTLPNSEDSIPGNYDRIRQTIADEMSVEPLTPSFDGSHSPARCLVRGRRELKELFTDDDLTFLIDRLQMPVKWAMAARQRNSNADRLLSELVEEELTDEGFIRLISDKTDGTDPDTGFMEWLGAKSPAWHQQLYATLYRRLGEPGRWNEKWDRIRECELVRLTDGRYGIGSECHFPSDELEESEQFSVVDARVYSSSASEEQRRQSREFLEAVGVREIDDAEEVRAILKTRYSTGGVKDTDWRAYKEDLNRFITLFEKDKGNARLFIDCCVLQADNGEWVKPCDVYLDSPYQDTGLRSFYDALAEEKRIRAKLSDAYLKLGVDYEKLVAFASACGAGERLEIRRCDGSLKGNEKLERLRSSTPGNHTRFEDYEDFFIEGLEDAILSRSIEVSRLVWQTLSECDFDWWEARYRKNRDRGYVPGLNSLLADLLMENEWVPQKDGTFVRPADALRERLPSGFHIDAGWEWLDKIGFERNRAEPEQDESERTEDIVDKESLAKKAGFESAKAMSEGQWFVGLPSEERERIRKKYDRMDIDRRPNQQSSNPDRRAYRVHEEGLQALQRKYEHRSRSVLVDQDGTKKQAEEYLRHQYTGGDGKMNCQVCQGELPFKLPSGEYYFEKVRFLDELVRNHRENYLALCPLHAAMYMHARTSPKSMLEALEELSGRELEVTLAENDETIYFTTNHINDIRAKVKSEEDTSGRGDSTDEEQGD